MASAIDFKELLPEHFIDNSQLLRDYLDSVGFYLNADIDDVTGLLELVNPNTVPIEYLQKLADILNLGIYGRDTQTEAQLRKQLIQAVDNYKIKGTYQSLINAAYLFDLHAEIKDMYTTDYVTFVTEDWFVGDVGVNPTDLNSNYYKSPHFGVWFLLDTEKQNTFGTIPTWDDSAFTWDDPLALWQGALPSYLWKSSDMTDFKQYVESIRPITTVPHYTIYMNPICSEDHSVQTVSGGIKTAVQTSWAYSNYFFDDGYVFDGDGSSMAPAIAFDFSATAFLSSITTYKLGIGNKGAIPTGSAFDLESIVITGTIASQVSTETYTEFNILVPLSTAQLGISELGLYAGTTLVVACTFPDVDKTSDVEFVIKVRVNKF